MSKHDSKTSKNCSNVDNKVINLHNNNRGDARRPDCNGRVLALGGCGIDILAYVDAHPLPDAKIRTNSKGVLYRGGGNAANTATALARLGVKVSLLTKVGDDANGSKIIAELAEEDVDVRFIVTKRGMPSASTIVIVAEQEQSRTCIHTPSTVELSVEDIKLTMEPEVWRDVVLLHLDSRHTQAAIYMATQARQRGIPVVLDAEKFRPSIEMLFPLCDVLVTSGAFPLTMSQQSTCTSTQTTLTLVQPTPEILLRMLLTDHCTSASMVICTFGAQGSMVYGKRRAHSLVHDVDVDVTSETSRRESDFLHAPFSESAWDTMFLQHTSRVRGGTCTDHGGGLGDVAVDPVGVCIDAANTHTHEPQKKRARTASISSGVALVGHTNHDDKRHDVTSPVATNDKLPKYFEVERRRTVDKLQHDANNDNNTDNDNVHSIDKDNNHTHCDNTNQSNNSNIAINNTSHDEQQHTTNNYHNDHDDDHNDNDNKDHDDHHNHNDHEDHAKYDGGEEFFATSAAFPLSPTQIVDSTGAGDAHAAGVCVAIMRRWKLRHALAFAARVSFHKLQGPGARDGLPNFKALSEFFQDCWKQRTIPGRQPSTPP